MFRLLAAVLEPLLGEVFEEALERVRQIVIWVIFVLCEISAIAGAAGLFGLGTVGRVLFGLGGVYLALDFKVNPW